MDVRQEELGGRTVVVPSIAPSQSIMWPLNVRREGRRRSSVRSVMVVEFSVSNKNGSVTFSSRD